MGKDGGKKIPRLVVMLGIVSLLTDVASEMIYPLVPVFVSLLGSGALILGVIEGVAETTAAMLKLAGGIISDRIGKRKILVLAGYTLSSLVRPLTGLVSAAWQIVVIRMTDRVGKGIRTAPRDALIASSADGSIRGKAYGFDRAMDHAGAVAGPLLAIITLLLLFLVFGIREPLNALRWTFLLAVIPGLLTIITIILFIHEPEQAGGNRTTFVVNLRNFDRNFRNYLIIMILFTLGNSSDAFLLYRVQEAIHQSGAVSKIVNSYEPLRLMISSFGDAGTQESVVNILFLPLVWAFFHIIKVIFSTPLGALSDRIGRKAVITAGWAVYAFVYFAFALLVFLPPMVQLAATFALFAIYALYYAFCEGAEKAFVADLTSAERRGTAFGLYNFSIGLGALPASLIFGFLYTWFDRIIPGCGGTVAFGFGGAMALLSVVLLRLRVREPAERLRNG